MWSELEEARHGTNSYGGDTAEIYAYRVMGHSPAVSAMKAAQQADRHHRPSGMLYESVMEDYATAKASLLSLCDYFARLYKVSITFDGVPEHEWKKVFGHRVHVQVLKREAA